MVSHDGVRQAINTEDGRQKLQAVANPLPTMFVRFTGNRIIAAEVSSTDTTSSRMANQPARGNTRRSWHRDMLPQLPLRVH